MLSILALSVYKRRKKISLENVKMPNKNKTGVSQEKKNMKALNAFDKAGLFY